MFFCFPLGMIYAKFEVLPNFNLKNMILSYAKDFSWQKNGPHLSVVFPLGAQPTTNKKQRLLNKMKND
jgi:hypothetical protein